MTNQYDEDVSPKLTAAQVEAMYGVTPKFLHGLAAAGKVAAREVDGVWLYGQTSVEMYLCENVWEGIQRET